MSIKLADKHNIPYQFKKTGVGGTDAGVIQIAGKGVKTIVFATPARYIHSPVSISSMDDVRSTFRLADVLLNNIK
jgi:endoglucanase